MTDAPGTGRLSFIGMNNYSAGLEYGQLMLDAASGKDKDDITALVLMSSSGSNESVLFSAIQDNHRFRRGRIGFRIQRGREDHRYP